MEYIVTVNGVTVYHAGDTSMFDGLKEIDGSNIDYAMYPIDGTYNVGSEEASKVADMVGARHNKPIHGMKMSILSKESFFMLKKN